MEITNRTDIGTNLWAPQLDDGGREYWSYSLVRFVREGDLVLHWSKQEEPGGESSIVGWSRVAGQPMESTIEWQSRGTYGRSRTSTGEEPAWLAPLTSYQPLDMPVTQTRMRALEPVVRQIRDNLQSKYVGGLYFPFAISDRRPLRAAQGYLVKFPRDLLTAIPELSLLLALTEAETDATSREQKHRDARLGVGRISDIEVRQAIERHAVEMVMAEFSQRGYKVADVGAIRSWDVEAEKNGERLHIEVKGSAISRGAIELTDNEVRHAEDYSNTALVVIDQISWKQTENGQVETSGGIWREWNPWTPSRFDLLPTRYRYILPDPSI